MYSLVREPIDVQAVRQVTASPADGAVVLFEGTVRNHSRGQRVKHLEYHSYEGMALKMLAEVGKRAKEQYEIREICIVHRLGCLLPGECSVAIIVCSAHRAPAFEACRFAIDTLKKTVPIWKKEVYEDGAVWIEGGN